MNKSKQVKGMKGSLRKITANELGDDHESKEGIPSRGEPGDSNEPDPVQREGDTLIRKSLEEGGVLNRGRDEEEIALDLPDELEEGRPRQKVELLVAHDGRGEPRLRDSSKITLLPTLGHLAVR